MAGQVWRGHTEGRVAKGLTRYHQVMGGKAGVEGAHRKEGRVAKGLTRYQQVMGSRGSVEGAHRKEGRVTKGLRGINR